MKQEPLMHPGGWGSDSLRVKNIIGRDYFEGVAMRAIYRVIYFKTQNDELYSIADDGRQFWVHVEPNQGFTWKRVSYGWIIPHYVFKTRQVVLNKIILELQKLGYEVMDLNYHVIPKGASIVHPNQNLGNWHPKPRNIHVDIKLNYEEVK